MFTMTSNLYLSSGFHFESSIILDIPFQIFQIMTSGITLNLIFFKLLSVSSNFLQ